MSIIIISALLIIISSISFKYINNGTAESISLGLLGFSVSTFIVCLILSAIAHSDYLSQREYNRLNQEYIALTKLCELDNGNYIAFANDIAEYNATVTNGRLSMNGEITRFYVYDFYYDLELIEFKSSENCNVRGENCGERTTERQ